MKLVKFQIPNYKQIPNTKPQIQNKSLGIQLSKSMRLIRGPHHALLGIGKNFPVRGVQPAKIINFENCLAQSIEKQPAKLTPAPAYIGMPLA